MRPQAEEYDYKNVNIWDCRENHNEDLLLRNWVIKLNSMLYFD